MVSYDPHFSCCAVTDLRMVFRTVKSLWTYLAGQGVDVVELWSRLEDLVVKTLISGEAAISTLIREHVSSRYCCYELFGVDVLLDQNLRPWLLEVKYPSAWSYYSSECIAFLFVHN